MDFTKPRTSAKCDLPIHGEYIRLNPECIPPLYIVWANNPSHSGKVHSKIKHLWEAGDSTVQGDMHRLAELTQSVLDSYDSLLEHEGALKLVDWMNANFDLRRRMFGDEIIGELNIRLIEMCRKIGCGAKFAGSGGACVVLCPNGANQVEELQIACLHHGFMMEQLIVQK